MCVLIVLISACSNSTYKRASVADVTLEIRFGTLYVTPYKGPTYRTSVKADEIKVLRPDIGTGQGGSMCSASIIKDNCTVATFDRSYVDDSKITKAELEQHFSACSNSTYKRAGVADVTLEILFVIMFVVVKRFLSRNRKQNDASYQK